MGTATGASLAYGAGNAVLYDGENEIIAGTKLNEIGMKNLSEGVVVAGIAADYGTPIKAPTLDAAEDYFFDGWEPSVPETMPAEDMTVVVKWRSKRPNYIPIDTSTSTAVTTATTTPTTTTNTTPDITKFNITGKQDELNESALKWEPIPNATNYSLYVKVDGKWTTVYTSDIVSVKAK